MVKMHYSPQHEAGPTGGWPGGQWPGDL